MSSGLDAIGAFWPGLDEATRLGVSGLLIGTLFGLVGCAFVLGGFWALRGRPALQPPTCRACGALQRAAATHAVPATCSECGADLGEQGSVRWFRYRRQPLTLGVTLPVVLVGGLLLAAGSTAFIVEELRWYLATRPVAAPRPTDARSAPPAAGLPEAPEPMVLTEILGLTPDALDALDASVAAGDVVAVTRWVELVQSGLGTGAQGLGRLGDAEFAALLAAYGRLSEACDGQDDAAQDGLRLALRCVLDVLLEPRGLVSSADRAADWAALNELTRLVGPQRVAPSSSMRLSLVVPGSTFAMTSPEVKRIAQDGVNVPFTLGGGWSIGAVVQAPAELGEHEFEVVSRGSGATMTEVVRRLRFEVVDSEVSLDPVMDEALDPAQHLALRSRANVVVEIRSVGRRSLGAVYLAADPNLPMLHGAFEVLGEGVSFRVPIGATPPGRRAMVSVLFEPRSVALPETIRLIYRPSPIDARPPHPPGEFATPGWWARPFALELGASSGRSTAYEPVRVVPVEAPSSQGPSDGAQR